MTPTEDKFLETTPLDVTIKALTSQIEELKSLQKKRLENDHHVSAVGGDKQRIEALEKEIQDLRTINAKAEYRIQILLNTLNQYDQQLSK
ncbi:hypothetical protein BC941DRAFT_419633 [Chlamydoabsidia padenii]|nr:hypothetical protein BC941DRAFT_419633 [Chlamydoabsidia padenii]